jgi:hypothetical protein
MSFENNALCQLRQQAPDGPDHSDGPKPYLAGEVEAIEDYGPLN